MCWADARGCPRREVVRAGQDSPHLVARTRGTSAGSPISHVDGQDVPRPGTPGTAVQLCSSVPLYSEDRIRNGVSSVSLKCVEYSSPTPPLHVRHRMLQTSTSETCS